MTGAPMTGHCLCGAVTVRVAGPHDPRPGACHCRMCQRWSGGLFLCFSADVAGVTVDGPVTRYASSDFAERAFCLVCGSHLWMRDNTGASYDLMPGLFDEARDQPLRSEVYADRAMASVRLQGDHRRATQAEYEQKNHHVAGVAP
ncbi:MAG: GFA family protein [Rhodobacter sp.]|nr:GFA family protein [Rhodobacter sp.]MCA3494758.1 GFA family protein [Rhodobacter sp.]MCA3499294.1 GFA family protein [Rhodobacter sp.]MCA3502350.1 GFA family protein [Rhodobacter sp.]MCA3516725.1 GFA family protein [Rhodobacter sp.]